MEIEGVKIDALIVQYMPLLKKSVAQYHSMGYEDYWQEAVIGLIIAAQKYNPQRGNFGAFAKVVIQNRLRNLYYRDIRRPLVVDFVAVEAGFEEGDESPGFDQSILQDEEEGYACAEMVATLNQTLDAYTQVVVGLSAVGFSQAEIAGLLGVSQATVSRRINGARSALNRTDLVG